MGQYHISEFVLELLALKTEFTLESLDAFKKQITWPNKDNKPLPKGCFTNRIVHK